MEVTIHATEELEDLAELIAKKVKPGNIVALYGDLGAGKTTFVRYLVSALGFKDRVQSPTYVLIRKYSRIQTSIFKRIYHADLYRLTSEAELSDLGLQELFSEKDSLIVIEWPEIVERYLPRSSVKVYFEYVDEKTRRINVQNLS